MPLRQVLMTVFYCLLALSLLPSQAVSSQTPTIKFPTVMTAEIVDFDPAADFRISNDAKYVYRRIPSLGSAVWERGDPLRNYFGVGGPGPTVTAGWSKNDTWFVEAEPGDGCTYPQLETTFVVFEVGTKKSTKFCIPVDFDGLVVAWSSVADPVLLMNEKWLLDIQTRRITRANFPSMVSLDNTDKFVGYGPYLWNPSTQSPEASVRMNSIQDVKTQQTTQAFSLCPLHVLGDNSACSPFLDLRAYGQIRVSGWKLSRAANMLLWGGQELPQASGATPHATQPATPSAAPSTATAVISGKPDTVLFLTELKTGATREIFRLSDLNDDRLFVLDPFDWSSDGKTIALRLRKADKNRPFAADSAGTLLVRLEWPK